MDERTFFSDCIAKYTELQRDTSLFKEEVFNEYVEHAKSVYRPHHKIVGPFLKWLPRHFGPLE